MWLQETLSYRLPPPLVSELFRALFTLLGNAKLEKAVADWKTLKSKVPKTFISDSVEYVQSQKDNLSAARMKKVASIISQHNITHDMLKSRCLLAAQFFTLVRATLSYHEATEQAKLVRE